MTVGEFQNTFRELFSRPKRERWLVVKEKGTNKTLFHNYLGASQACDHKDIYSKCIEMWAFSGTNTIIVVVK